MTFAVFGPLVHCCPAFGSVVIEENSLVIVVHGRVEDVQRIEAGNKEETLLKDALDKHRISFDQLVRLKPGQMLLPGFIDIHVHAPQYRFTGTATDTPLMQWLHEYTFPCEAAMQHLATARDVYTKAVTRLLKNGTTTAMYFGTIHNQANMLLVDVVRQLGQRALVGKVCMDQHSVDYYIESTQEALTNTEAFIQHVGALGDPLVQPVITPRFIPTCSLPLLQGLGALVKKYPQVHVQSHISESVDQVVFTQSMHPDAPHDADIYDRCGLLTDKTVMAHGVFLGDHDTQLFKERGAAVAHCPLSNVYFAEHMLRVKHLQRQGVKIGLATDVAGGYSPSMLVAMRSAVVASRVVHMHRVHAACAQGGVGVVRESVPPPPESEDVLTFQEALWLATVGSATALGMQDEIGALRPGLWFDALLVDCTSGAAFDHFDCDTPMDLLEKFINLGDDRHIVQVWVGGRICA